LSIVIELMAAYRTVATAAGTLTVVPWKSGLLTRAVNIVGLVIATPKAAATTVSGATFAAIAASIADVAAAGPEAAVKLDCMVDTASGVGGAGAAKVVTDTGADDLGPVELVDFTATE
jgi:hypothetical protein